MTSQQAKSKRRLSYYQLDVIDESAIIATFAKLIPTLMYPLKGPVACAGMSLNCSSAEILTSPFRRVLDINVTGTFLIL